MAPASDASERRPKTARDVQRRRLKPDEVSQAASDEIISGETYGKAKKDTKSSGANTAKTARIDPKSLAFGQVPKAAEYQFGIHAAGTGDSTSTHATTTRWRVHHEERDMVPVTVMPEDFRGTGVAIRPVAKFDAQSVTKSDFRAPKAEAVEEAHRHKDLLHAGNMIKGRRYFTDITRHTEMRDGSGLVGIGAWRAAHLLEVDEEEPPEEEENDEDMLLCKQAEEERREKRKKEVMRQMLEKSSGVGAVLKMPKDQKNARPVVGTRSEILKNYKPPRRSSSVVGSEEGKGSKAPSESSRRSRSSSQVGKESSDRGKRRQKGNRRATSASGGGSSRGSAASLVESEVSLRTEERLRKVKIENRFKGHSTQQAAYRAPPLEAYKQILPYQ